MTYTLGELQGIASELLQAANGCRVWLFEGELGAGKTTIIKSVCTLLGVQSSMTSPTFSIVNEYGAANGVAIYHFDFYRLKKEEEAYDIGVDEYLDSGNYCFIEWPDRIASLIPEKYFGIKIFMKDSVSRTIDYKIHE